MLTRFFQKFSKGNNSIIGDNLEKKEKYGSAIFMRKPYKKFQVSGFKGLKVTVGTNV